MIDKNQALVNFYNKITTGTRLEPIREVYEIPEDVLLFLSYYNYSDLIKGFVAIESLSKRSMQRTATKYRQTCSQVRTHRQTLGFSPIKKKRG